MRPGSKTADTAAGDIAGLVRGFHRSLGTRHEDYRFKPAPQLKTAPNCLSLWPATHLARGLRRRITMLLAPERAVRPGAAEFPGGKRSREVPYYESLWYRPRKLESIEC